jgi:uncharacterized protein YegL
VTGALYVLVDTSGSTARLGFNDGWNRALPLLVGAVEDTAGHDCRVCLLSYATDAQVRVALTAVRDLTVIPSMPPAGLSSLAAGLRLLARTIREDRDQLASDRIESGPSTALILADGLPTDSDADVLAARDLLTGDPTALHVGFPEADDALAFAGLRAKPHPMAVGDADRVTRAIVAVTHGVLESR